MEWEKIFKEISDLADFFVGGRWAGGSISKIANYLGFKNQNKIK